jgi:phenylacetate-coenzyme A ligase PaaK-like adenylate-forming protein
MNLKERIFGIDSDDSFNDVALKIFRHQHENNLVYRQFIEYLGVKPDKITAFQNIPFLPIGFFKTHKILSEKVNPLGYFQSSGTTASTTSKHYYENLDGYEASFTKGFDAFFGDVTEYCILALLPSYLQQKNSSLIYMIQKLVELSGHPDSGFYLYNYDDLQQKINTLEQSGQKTILIGVTFALLDLLDKFQFSLKNTRVMETGGMKGRRKEMVREELHEILHRGFGIDKIYSEYGMTELFSQAWSEGAGIFKTPPWMKILIRDVNDPLSLIHNHKTGGINVIDLANIDSCSFIATQDLGRSKPDGSFEILGRFDNSDVRGCNLLIS